jgi:hypothetical protein
MKRRSWKVWVAGIALVQLLVLGVDVALLWPSQAEQIASRLREGMTETEVEEAVGRLGGLKVETTGWKDYRPSFDDGSSLTVEMVRSERLGQEWRVRSFRVVPSAPAHPLTRLRRTLARVFPFVAK